MSLSTVIAVALSNANCDAFLRVIRQGETSQLASAYTELYGGGQFTDLSDHPFRHRPHVRLADGRTTSAAGAYQAELATWDDFIRACGPHDFSPASQDAFAVWCVWRRGALDDVLAGRLEVAVAKCRQEWTSLPGAAENSGRYTLAQARAVYQQWGGRFAPDSTPGLQPPAPIEDHSPPPTPPPAVVPAPEKPVMPIAIALLAQLIPQVLSLFTGRAQASIAKSTGASPEVAGQFFQSLIGKVGEAVSIPVTDETTATQAVAALTAMKDADAKAAAVKSLEDHSLDYLHKLSEPMQALVDVRQAEARIDSESANASSVRNDAAEVRRRFDKKVWWAYGIIGAVLLTIVIVELVLTKIVDGQIVGALILAFGAMGGMIGTIAHYGYGSTASSGAKDVMIGEIARRNINGGTQ